jgi:rSAM/selenodomain-associated transferase 2
VNFSQSSPASNGPPQLAVIIPTLDEREVLPHLLADLARQEDVSLELLVSDGGSTDGTVELVRELAVRFPFPLALLAAPRGRASQMNAAAAAAHSTMLFFLHADSRLPSPSALRQGLDQLAARRAAAGHDRLAGHFTLQFCRSDPTPNFGYYFFEAKARLDRPGCTHGDQGFLLSRAFFARVGPFPAGFPMLAETRLAERVRAVGEWCLLSPTIQTSARRFELEGLRERQTLNAMLMSCAAIDWQPFFRELPDLYHGQGGTGKLRLLPFLERIRELLAAAGPMELRRFWRATGGYVRDNAWQLALRCDLRRAFRAGLLPGGVDLTCLARHDRFIAPLLAGRLGAVLGELLTRLWFYGLIYRERRKESQGCPP